jgi:hypothetical protein
VKVLGTFKTGDAADKMPPRLEDMIIGSAVREAGLTSLCGTNELYVSVAVTASDEDTPAAGILYGVWVGNGSASSAVPLTYVEPAGGRISLGRPNKCSPANAVLPDPRRTPQWHLVFRPVDLAGNWGTRQRITIDLRHPSVELRP